MVDALGAAAIEIARKLDCVTEVSIWIIADGGYAKIDKDSAKKLSIDEAIEIMRRGEYIWVRPLP